MTHTYSYRNYSHKKRIAKRIAIVLAIVLSLGAVAAYADIEPFATYADVARHEIAKIDLNIEIPRQSPFSGTYRTVVPLLNFEQTLAFKGNTVTIVDELTGMNMFQYTVTFQSDNEGTIELTDMATGQVSNVLFKKLSGTDCFVLYPLGKSKGGLTYCK